MTFDSSRKAPETNASTGPARKPYRKPRLRIYGDLAEITGTLMGKKTRDGSTHVNKHFTS
jgi:hypothetical protein